MNPIPISAALRQAACEPDAARLDDLREQLGTKIITVRRYGDAFIARASGIRRTASSTSLPRSAVERLAAGIFGLRADLLSIREAAPNVFYVTVAEPAKGGA
jgi:hypothetical protein